jgi:hypothetical protein
MQRRGIHTFLTTEELPGNGVFYLVRAENLKTGQFEATSL